MKVHRLAKRPKLTISLLSSGRVDTIERCLRSIDKLKTWFWVEIVVVDTDSRHNVTVRKILERYADKIIDFEWCDDFSAARNAGMEASTGEWFMYIDDDEYFSDSKALVDFLKSSENKKYSWCNVQIRNYLSQDYKAYTDSWATRLIRKEKDTHFEGIIHECFASVTGEPKNIDGLMIEHTGYIYQNEEEKQNHSKRNIKLLNKAIETDECNTRLWVQQLQEYGAINDLDRLEELCDKYLAKSKNITPTAKNKRYVMTLKGLLVSLRIRIECLRGDWIKAKELFGVLPTRTDYGLLASSHIKLTGAIIFFNLKDYNTASLMIIDYIKGFKAYKYHESDYAEDAIYFLTETFEAYNLQCVSRMIYTIDSRKQ